MDADVVEELWAQIEPIVFITREQFVAGLADWNVTPIRLDGELAYIVLTQGPEIHYAALGENRISISLIRSWLAPLLAQYGYATTRTPKTETRQIRLNQRIGGFITHEDEFFVHFRLDS